MFRLSLGLLVLALIGSDSAVSPASAAWPHRAILTSLHERPAPFRAYTRGGVLIIAVDASGRRTTASATNPRLRALTNDTIRAETPADFPLDLTKGPVVFIAEGRDTLHLVVGRNPFGGVDRVQAKGLRFTVRLVADRFVIDTR